MIPYRHSRYSIKNNVGMKYNLNLFLSLSLLHLFRFFGYQFVSTYTCFGLGIFQFTCGHNTIVYQGKSYQKEKRKRDAEAKAEEMKIITAATSSNQLKLSFPFVRPLMNTQTYKQITVHDA